MKTNKKDSLNTKNTTNVNTNLMQTTRDALFAAKKWALDDASLLSAYWHQKMGYMEAWTFANWHLVLEKGQDALHELEELEDLALLWLVDHANNNPVPLKDCHVAGNQGEEGDYQCMACSTMQIMTGAGEIKVCPECGYGLFSTHAPNTSDND